MKQTKNCIYCNEEFKTIGKRSNCFTPSCRLKAKERLIEKRKEYDKKPEVKARRNELQRKRRMNDKLNIIHLKPKSI